MNILIFTTQFHTMGGYERLAVELAEEINKQGTRADLLSQYTNYIEGVAEAKKKLHELGIPNILFLGLRVNPNLLDIFLAVLRLRKLVKNKKYTAIEVSGFGPSFLAAIALVGLNIPVLVGFHEMYSSRHSGVKYLLWFRLLRNLKYLKFLAISKAVSTSWIKSLKLDPQRVTVVYNSINTTFYYPKALPSITNTDLVKIIGAQSDHKIILFVGRLMKSKGIDTLYNSLKQYLVSYRLHLLFVGRSDHSEDLNDIKLLDYIQKDVLKSPWRKHVHFMGTLSNVDEIMAASDILVHPARSEGFGLVLAESLAIGLPIIASNVGGIPEVLTETDSILIPSNDSNSLVNAVFSILEWSPEKLAKAKIKGKERAKVFQSSIRAREIIKLLNK